MRRPLKAKDDSNAAKPTLLTPSATVYEVRCHECDVSYPVGTKRCMYCGNRPGQRSLFTRDLAPDPLTDFAPLGDLATPEVSHVPSTLDYEEEDEEGTQRGGSVFRAFGNFTWIILFAVITIYRWCAG